MGFYNIILYFIILISYILSLVYASDCSVIQDILTLNNKEIPWKTTNSTGCCSYEGVSCVNDRIIQINFSSKSLTGSLESLMSLTSLQYINISNCKFTGSIPSSIQNLSNLQYLYADRNSLTGNIPSEIAIPNLQFIDLSGNKLEGSIPSSLGRVLNLQHINLAHNNLSGSVPSSFRSLKNIQSLIVSDNRQLCGEIPVLSDTLKDCNFGSTSLCIQGTREHCTNNIKKCDSVNCNGDSEPSTTQTSKPTDTEINTDPDNSNENNNINNELNDSDFAETKKPVKDSILKWVAIGFIIVVIICIVILLLICLKRRYSRPIIIEKPLKNSNKEIFVPPYDQNMEDDPDASIQIHSLSRPQQVVVPVIESEGGEGSQTSSFDLASPYDSLGRSSLYDSLGRNPINTNSLGRNQGLYTTNSLGRNPQMNAMYLAGPSAVASSGDEYEQDLGDIVVANNNDGHIYIDGTLTSTQAKRLSNLTNYSKSQSSPNLVRLNRYSLNNPNLPTTTAVNRRSNTNFTNFTISESPKLSASGNSSPNLDVKRSRHSSTPFPVSPFTVKNSKRGSDKKIKTSISNDDIVNNHNMVHVVNSRKSMPFNLNGIDKSATTITNNTNYSDNTTSTNITNNTSIHSSTPIISKIPIKKQNILNKYSSQSNMNASPLINSYDYNNDNDDIESPTDSINNGSETVYNESSQYNNKRNSNNPSNLTSNNNSYKDAINNKASNETFPKMINPNKINRNSVNITSQQMTITDNILNISSSSDELAIGKPLNTSLDTNISSLNSNIFESNSQNNIRTDPTLVYNNEGCHANVNTNTNILSEGMEVTENISEEILIEPQEEIIHSHTTGNITNNSEDFVNNNNNNNRILEEDNEYQEIDNIPEDLREEIEEPQPPNYEEVFSETLYSPYIENNNDDAIRMQLEMRRIEERQLRMEYLQRQIANPDLSNVQRQKYIDALDRLMLE